jgi:tetratricopeptide (TPR) repeat protein
MIRATISSAITVTVITALSLGFAMASQAEPDYRSIAFYPILLDDDSSMITHDMMPAALVSIHNQSTPVSSLLEISAEKYRTSINNLELSGGPFNPMLAEQYLALGDLLEQTGDYDAAIKAWEKSLHILRVNDGLHSQEQQQLLRKLIHARLARKEFTKADELHEALFYQQLHHYQKDDAGYIAAILEWTDWNVDRLLLSDAPMVGMNGRGDSINQNLIDAQEKYIEAIELIRESGETSQARQQTLVYAERKLAAINYIANGITMVSDDMFFSAFDANDSPFSSDQRHAENAGMAFFFNGSNALKRAIAYSLESPQPDYLSIAEQMMALGDWYLLFNRRSAALAIYADAFEVLDAVQASDIDIRQIMSPGMPVSTLGSLSSRKTGDNPYEGYIDVVFQVSKFGIASSPEVIASSTQYDSPVTNALIRRIRQEKFRPAFIDGSATSSENVKMRYYFSYN